MASHRRFDLDELVIRPGTYFNPQTEVLVVVDDSPQIDHEVFDDADLDSEQWVLVSDETPLDEHRRDELIEEFQASHHAGDTLDDGDDPEDEEDELEPDEDPEDLD